MQPVRTAPEDPIFDREVSAPCACVRACEAAIDRVRVAFLGLGCASSGRRCRAAAAHQEAASACSGSGPRLLRRGRGRARGGCSGGFGGSRERG